MTPKQFFKQKNILSRVIFFTVKYVLQYLLLLKAVKGLVLNQMLLILRYVMYLTCLGELYYYLIDMVFSHKINLSFIHFIYLVCSMI